MAGWHGMGYYKQYLPEYASASSIVSDLHEKGAPADLVKEGNGLVLVQMDYWKENKRGIKAVVDSAEKNAQALYR